MMTDRDFARSVFALALGFVALFAVVAYLVAPASPSTEDELDDHRHRVPADSTRTSTPPAQVDPRRDEIRLRAKCHRLVADARRALGAGELGLDQYEQLENLCPERAAEIDSPELGL